MSTNRMFIAQMVGASVGFVLAVFIASLLPPDRPLLGSIIGAGFTCTGMLLGVILYAVYQTRNVR